MPVPLETGLLLPYSGNNYSFVFLTIIFSIYFLGGRQGEGQVAGADC